MRILVLTLMVGTIGSIVGYATSVVLLPEGNSYGFSKPYSGVYSDNQIDGSFQEFANRNSGKPRVEVIGESVYDFGVMQKDETRSHIFRIKNSGKKQLQLVFDAKSCQCTNVSNPDYIEPGQEGEIIVDWKPTKYNLEFNQSALFRTNDPSHPELKVTIKGRVQQILRNFPQIGSFGSFTTEQNKEVLVELFSYRDKDFAIERIEIIGEDSPELFSVASKPMSDRTVKNEPGAKSGATITMALSPGMPPGRFIQRVRVFHNKDDIGPFDIPFIGNVAGNISMIGPKCDVDNQLVRLGKLPGNEVSEATFWLLIKGESHEDVVVSVEDVEASEVLSVSVLDRQLLGKLSKIPIKLTVTPGASMVNRSGSKQGKTAKVRLKTTNLKTTEYLFRVAFSVPAKQ